MCGKRLFLVLVAGMICWDCCLTLSAQDDWVTVVPEQTDDILANPGMGWQTFHHTAANDRNLPAWISSTVQYIRWGWRDLEPKRGVIDQQYLDGVLKETRAAGQTLALRVMCCSSSPRQPYHPSWLERRHCKKDPSWKSIQLGGAITFSAATYGAAVQRVRTHYSMMIASQGQPSAASWQAS